VKRDRSKGRPIYVGLDVITSTAFLSLGGRSPHVFMLFLTKRQVKPDGTRRERWKTVNNGEIRFTYVEAEDRWKIPRTTFQRALRELEAKGFIDLTFRGSGMSGSANLYAISERWRRWGTDDFEEAPKPAPHNKAGFKAGHDFYPAGGSMEDL
jgi:hypothetical protein